MTISPAAQRLLQRLLDTAPGADAIAFDGAVGNCRASVPLLRAVRQQPPHTTARHIHPFTFFVHDDYLAVFDAASLDYQDGLFARGLHLTWPHRDGGCPNCAFD